MQNNKHVCEQLSGRPKEVMQIFNKQEEEGRMKVPESVMDYIKREVEHLDYGRVIIEVQATSNKIDVVTESRQRFPIVGDDTLLLKVLKK